MTTILVCGGRDYDNYERMATELNARKPDRVITGDARGADMLAYHWCLRHGVSYQGYPADWKNFGRAAGPMRNSQMLNAEKIDLVLAFPGGSGTRDMIAKAFAKDITVEIIE